jgi:hypothetical protein
VCDAFRDAGLLCQALRGAFAGKQSFEDALAEYERQRNEQTLADYHDNAARAQFPKVDDQALQLRRALRHNPEETRNFYFALQRRVPPQSFFNSENIGRIVGLALAGSRTPAS